MSHVQDEQLFMYAERVKNKVVVITGAANGIGKETALSFASYGAKIVIGDLDIAGAAKVVEEIEKTGGSAVALKVDVTNFDQQAELFSLAIKKYGSVDIVIPNAGVTEIGSFKVLNFKDGKPVKPITKTLEINLFGALYTAHLAIHYLDINKKEDDLKSLIFIGSMASWQAIPSGEMYSASKHAILGTMRALYPIMELKGIRVGSIHPFFADTGIVPKSVKLLLAGIPLTSVSRVAGAIFYAATDIDTNSNGSAWLLVDDGPVFQVPKEEFKEGVYKMIDERANKAKNALKGAQGWIRIGKDVWRIIGKEVVVTGLAVVLAKAVWNKREVVKSIISS